MLCEYCIKKEGSTYYSCKCSGEICPWQRWCPTERQIVMTDIYKKCGCKIKKQLKEKGEDQL